MVHIHVTWPCPFHWWLVTHGLGLATITVPTTFKVSISSHYTDMKIDINVENWVICGNQQLLKVTGNLTIWYSTYDFLLAFYGNCVLFLYHFLGVVRYWLKITDFNQPYLYLTPAWGWPHWSFTTFFGVIKLLESLGYHMALFAWS